MTTGLAVTTRVFPARFVLTRAFPGKTSQEVTHPNITPRQAHLTMEFFMSWAPEKKMHLVVMSSTNQIFYALLNCIVPYLYSLGFTSCSGAVSVQSCVPPPRSLPGAAPCPCLTAPAITPRPRRPRVSNWKRHWTGADLGFL